MSGKRGDAGMLVCGTIQPSGMPRGQEHAITDEDAAGDPEDRGRWTGMFHAPQRIHLSSV